MDPIGTQPNSPNDEILWKQYALHVDLYKFYLDLGVKVNAFYYAVTGSILTYYFQCFEWCSALRAAVAHRI